MFANAIFCAAISATFLLPPSNPQVPESGGQTEVTLQDLAGDRLLDLARDSSLPPAADKLKIGFPNGIVNGREHHPNAVAPLDGEWRLRWDDEVGNGIAKEFHECRLRLKSIGTQVEGEFMGPVAGTIRHALITGKLVRTGGAQLLIFEQHEANYCCHYQINFANGIGTWVDTRGRRGDFELLKFPMRKTQ